MELAVFLNSNPELYYLIFLIPICWVKVRYFSKKGRELKTCLVYKQFAFCYRLTLRHFDS